MYDKNVAFAPRDEKKVSDAVKAARAKSEKLKDEIAIMLSDVKYKQIKAKIKEYQEMTVKVLLSIDMNSDSRYQIQAESRVIASIFDKLERLEKA